MSKGGAWKTGGGRAWRELRLKILERDARQGWGCRAHEEGWCAKVYRRGTHQCAGVVHPVGGHAHHTLGRMITGDDERYIVASCPACNHWIGDPLRTPDPPATPVTRW